MRLTLTWMFVLVATVVGADEAAIDFGRHVRPILSDHCFACHGPDQQQRKADLRLDTSDGLASLVVAGDVESSELISRITADDPDERMPPASFHKPLSQPKIDLLQRWVSQGAKITQHWSFTAPVKAAGAPDQAPVAIDCFIDQQIQAAGLTANAREDRRTLLRRVCLDLTGLPPTRQQLQQFVSDDSPDAYQRLVDRLLLSPHFGQHVGRYWLDLVRYGDTHGLHLDNYREMWPYRDWVIDAFNTNMPYDEFIKRQLAGDLLPQATDADRIASGFNRLNITTGEGGSIDQEVFVRNVIDRTDAFGTIFLGLTTGCAVCHDHKFDPITSRDYYSLAAFFNSLDGNAMDGNAKDHAPSITVPSDAQRTELEQIDEIIAGLTERMSAPIQSVDQAQLVWQGSLLGNHEPRIETLMPVAITSAAGVEMNVCVDGSVEIVGSAAATDTTTIIAELPTGAQWQTVKLEALTDTPQQRVGASDNGNVVLTEIVIETSDSSSDGQWVAVPITAAYADVEQADGPFLVKFAFDGQVDDGQGWGVAGHQTPGGRTASFATPSLIAEGENPQLRVQLKYLSKFAKHQFRRVRLSVVDAPPSESVAEIPKHLLQAIRSADGNQDEKMTSQIRDHYRQHVCQHPDWLVLVDQVAGAKKAKADLEKQLATTLVWKELEKPRQAHVLIRGQYDQPGDPVTRGTPEFLPDFPSTAPLDRLGLAQWLTSADHPLTARVAVNRFWQQVFGVGLVKTSEDFGSQGEPPSHVELLDWLAVDFQENGWDVKRLIKSMVMSEAYRRSAKISDPSDPAYQIDPTNRLLARGPRYRLDAEMLRDQALSLSGLIIDRQGGPSVKPPQPDGLWKAVGYSGSNTVQFVADSGDKIYRRSVYTFWKRTAPPPQMSTFDAPSRESCTARRERTNTPLQALLLMNEQQYVEAARALAKRTLTQSHLGTLRQRVQWIFETVTCRLPSEPEMQELETLLAELTEHYSMHPDDVEKLIGASDASEAAWTILASTLLNLDEVISK